MSEINNKRILLCVDDKQRSDHAFDYYVNKIHKDDHEVIILHVSDNVSISTAHIMTDGVSFTRDEIEKKSNVINSKNKEMENKYKRRSSASHIKYKMITVSSEDRVGHTICANAERYSVSLIVLGTRGLGKLQRAFLGSVGDYVLHHSSIPVLVVPNPN